MCLAWFFLWRNERFTLTLNKVAHRWVSPVEQYTVCISEWHVLALENLYLFSTQFYSTVFLRVVAPHMIQMHLVDSFLGVFFQWNLTIIWFDTKFFQTMEYSRMWSVVRTVDVSKQSKSQSEKNVWNDRINFWVLTISCSHDSLQLCN